MDFNQYKILILAALSGYIGTLINGIPNKLINLLFYLFGFTMSTATDLGWDSYMGVYMAIRKLVDKNKKYYKHMGGYINVETPSFFRVDENEEVYGYDCLTDEEKKLIDEIYQTYSIFDFLKGETKIKSIINKVKMLPEGNYLIYLGGLTWMRIYSATTYRENINTSSGNSTEAPPKPNYKIRINVFGWNQQKVIKTIKESCDWWVLYYNNASSSEKISYKINNMDDLKNFLNRSTLNEKQLELHNTKNGIITYKMSRTFDSIFLDNKNDIINAMRSFLTLNKLRKYINLEIPYKLNILLYGKPGTGKTSILYALANEFTTTSLIYSLEQLDKLPIIGNMPGIFDPTSRIYNKSIIDQLPDMPFKLNSISIIEEIDTIFGYSGGNRENIKNASFEDLLSNSNGSLKYLLEWLDGTKTPFGNICICTTNHIEKLDPALIRRFDYVFHIDGISLDTANDMIKYYGLPSDSLKNFNKNDYMMDNGLINPSKLSNLLINKFKEGVK